MAFVFAMVNCAAAFSADIDRASLKQKANLSLYVFEGNHPVKDFYVWMDKGITLNTSADKVASNENGGANFTLSKGEHQLSVARKGYDNAVINLNVVENENLQIIVTQYPGKSIPHVSIESSQDNLPKKSLGKKLEIIGEPGILKGRITNSENSDPVAGARLFFSGLATDFETDKDGYFEAKVPSSTYSISILHNRYASQTLDGVEVKAGETLEKKISVTPAGIALTEFVVVAPFIQGSVSSLVDERKDTKVVSDFVGAEQMSKSGDGDAAAALTRVAGLTLIDGKYAVVRGMSDRYTTVLMNDAIMRSPDPSSKSVDLDMFPSSILDSIEVQKTYSADAPGAFGGGVIKLRTKSLPEDDFIKIKVSTGGNTNVTGKSIISQVSGDTDYLGIDDGGRELPVESNPKETLSESEAELFSHRFQTTQVTANPDMGLALSFGQLFNVWGMKTGYQAYLGYSNKWSYEEGEKNNYGAFGSVLSLRDDQIFQKSKYSVDTTALFNGALEDEVNSIKSTTSLIRKSYRLTRVDEGISGETGEQLRKVNLEWSERELFSQQFNGEHALTENITANWQYGFSNTSLYNPDGLSYRYDNNITDTDVLYYRDGEATRDFLNLNDDNQSLVLSLSAKLKPLSFLTLDIKTGYSLDSTDRSSKMIRFKYNWFNIGNEPVSIISQQNPDDILSAENLRDDGYLLKNSTLASDSYDANSETTAFYGMVSSTWFDDLDVTVGARSESFAQNLNTFDTSGGDPIKVNQATNNILPSVLATYRFAHDFQLRVALAETVNRPSMLELSQSIWVDPVSGGQSIGNPRLVEANISHFDGRLEWYGEGANTVSLAYFSKDFKNPIERTLKISSGAGELVTYKNAQSATNSGVEMDFRYDLEFLNIGDFSYGISGNYSVIESNVILPIGHTEYSDTRTMQGQSPYTMNAMFTVDHAGLGLETAFVLNEIGERITRVGQGDVPHVYEQPFTALDFTLSKEIGEGKVSLKMKNLLSNERLFTQGGEVYQKTDPGMSFSFSYGQSF